MCIAGLATIRTKKKHNFCSFSLKSTAMKNIAFSAAIMLVITSATAQNMWGVNVKIHETKGDFNKNVSAVPVGISFNYLHGFKDKFSIGGELGIAMYANNQYDFETPGGTIKVDEEDCFWTIHSDFRYYFYRTPAVKAYAQARVGLTTFFSSITPTKETSEFRETFNFHGTAFNTGVGGGILLNFGSVFKKEPGPVNLDLGVALHSGSSTDYRYMREGSQSVTLEDGVYRSVTNYMDYRIGILFSPRN